MSLRRLVSVLAAGTFLLCALISFAQDSQSLGDVARQTRQQKQQKEAQAQSSTSKDASAKDSPADATSKDASRPKSTHVITNEDIPEHVGPTLTSDNSRSSNLSHEPSDAGSRDARAEQWKSQILSQKNAIASLKHQMDSLSESIRYAPANCVSGCVQWNEHQKQKQDEVDRMKAQLDDQQNRLEAMQEAARQQGFGSSVYDP